MRICVIGTRGFPNIQGGVETHCEKLYTQFSDATDLEFIIFRRSKYVDDKYRNCKEGNIRFVDLFVFNNKYLETIVHSFCASLHTLFYRPSIVHFHNAGPGLFIPLLKLFNIKCVLTIHSRGQFHNKWGFFSKLMLVFFERVSLKYADSVIFVSEHLKDQVCLNNIIKRHYVIPNGVDIVSGVGYSGYLESIELISGKYILAAGRFTEEKGFDYLIEAYNSLNLEDFKLVIIGDSDYPTKYSRQLKNKARESGVVLPGFLKNEKLNEIFSNASLFVMPSYTEGLPIAILEAMSFNLDILASDIRANLDIQLGNNSYFKVGDVEDLAQNIQYKLMNKNVLDYSDILRNRYNWELISIKTMFVYNSILI
jgi:alpha-maltose-1-phosphate synthase